MRDRRHFRSSTMTPTRSFTFRKCCAALLGASLALQPLGAYAAAITPITTSVLAEIPVQGVSRVKPNIMLTIDDSGSMLWDFVPDYAGFAGPGISHCRDWTLTPGYQCGGLDKGFTFLFNGYVAT